MTADLVGVYQRSNGRIVAIRSLDDHHLINALLRALAHGEPERVTRPLAAEIVRRGISEMALDVAAERDPSRRVLDRGRRR